MTGRIDRELVAGAIAGDPAAVGELYRRYWRAARATAVGVLGDVAAAEDAAADAFQTAWASLGTLRDAERYDPWLRTIVVRTARRELRRRGRHDGEPVADVPAPEQGIDATLARLDTEIVVRSAVRRLPPHVREAVWLVYLEGFETAAAAVFLGIPSGTLRRRLHDGRARLRAELLVMLERGVPVDTARADEIVRLQRLAADADRNPSLFFEAMRGALALRPPAREVMELLTRGNPPSVDGPSFLEAARTAAARLASTPVRSEDPDDPLSAIALSIRRALPAFTDWILDPSHAIPIVTGAAGIPRDPQASLPDELRHGRAGAFIRASRGVLCHAADGTVLTTYQVLHGSHTPQAFGAQMATARLCETLELTWMEVRPIDLREVQAVLRHVLTACAPRARAAFSPYDEPRYRAALIVHFEGVAAPAAIGGVLVEWPGHPAGATAAHARIFLDSWVPTPPEA